MECVFRTFVSLDDNTLIISTVIINRKEIIFFVPANLDVNQLFTVMLGPKIIIYTLIMGFTSKNGLLIVEVQKQK